MSKKKKLWLLKLAVGIFLTYFIYRNVYQKEQFFQVFKSADWSLVLICVLLLIPNFAVQFLKWRYILHRKFPDIENAVILKSLLFGATLGFITPGNLGELARALYFKKYDRWVITALNVLDKFSGILIFLTIGIVSVNYLILTRFAWPMEVSYPLAILSSLFIIMLWVLVLHPVWILSLKRFIREDSSIWKKIGEMAAVLGELKRRDMLVVAALALVWFFVIIIQYHVVISAYESVAFYHTFLAVSATLFTKVILPVSFGDLGIREGAAVFYYSLMAVSPHAAFNAAFLIFIINFLLPALAGSLFVFRLRWGNDGRRRES